MADTTQLKVEKEKLEEENRNLKQRNGKLQKEIQSKFILLSQRDEEFAIYKQKMEKREADPNILVRLNKEKTLLQEDDWEELRIMVNVISPDFTHHLLDSCPKLSESDVRFCSLIKLGYTLPDLCILLGVQEEAVAKRKSRIKKRIDEGKKWKKGEFDAYLKSF